MQRAGIVLVSLNTIVVVVAGLVAVEWDADLLHRHGLAAILGVFSFASTFAVSYRYSKRIAIENQVLVTVVPSPEGSHPPH